MTGLSNTGIVGKLPKVVTTIHIDQTSTLDDVRRAVDQFAKVTARTKQLTDEKRTEMIEMIRNMVHTLTKPFELRVDAPDAAPVIVVHPGKRAPDWVGWGKQP